ncbi:MAG: hypothetical protein DPW09_34030 [Anaerolineae bacterium]|nr:hypothetical protein [Anaerolineae bacterium]
MISAGSVRINERLRLGIAAARANQNHLAIHHLTTALRQEPDNIFAMLWLAYVLPAPEDSLRLLERALALDPQNESAKVGWRWARGRLGLPPDEPALVSDQTRPRLAQTVPFAVQQPVHPRLSINPQPGKTNKTMSVRRVHRRLKPLLAIIFSTLVFGMGVMGLSALIFAPLDSLAAWLPARPVSPAAEVATPQPTVNPAPSSSPMTKHFTSDSDTLTLVVSGLDEPETVPSDPPAPSPKSEPLLEATVPEALPQTNLTSIDPSLLIGPELPLATVDRSRLAHQPAYPGEKWIEVNVATQQVIAWEGDKPVMAFTVSTGVPETPTVLGEFNIYWKLESTLMTGPGYYLPEVPYTMYFYEGYALHGTYWHNNFGQRMSRGCVNLQTDNAKQLFEWADPIVPPGQIEVVATHENPGTLVVVHE